MKIDRFEHKPKAFVSYSVNILIEHQQDADVLKSLLRKLEGEVKPNGMYDSIISQLIAALG